MGMDAALSGGLFRRGECRYEAARADAIWHAGTPARFPKAIYRVTSVDDVIAALSLARREGLQVSVRSGGHSWAGSHLRDGVLLIDVSALRDFTVDEQAMTASAQPGLRGAELGAALGERGLFFPVGHCQSVCLGGYLLQGGFPWRGREFGPSCMSVTGIDVVTADGKHLFADDTHHSDLFWAARGSGPGFFAVVTRFYLTLRPLQKITRNSAYVYPPEVWEEYFRWSRSIERTLSPRVELWNMLYRDDAFSTAGPVISVSASAFTETEEEAQDLLHVFEECPVRGAALVAHVCQPTTVGELTRLGSELHYPPDKRYIADNMWTRASFDDLRPNVKTIVDDFPPAPSHLVWFPWTMTPPRPPMAYSVEDELYIAVYAAWDRADQDEKYRRWVTDRMQAMESLATGIQLADKNLINRPHRFVTDENLHRLDQIKTSYDPDELFVSWLGRPHTAAS
ncbi:MAG: FAD-binding oxidoreductase [Mycobacteriaceae bacterium]|nr:FAD-binding oxidoreductase [Mycobacteriaceae bacterium]